MKWIKASLDKKDLPSIRDGEKIYFIKYFTTGWEKETGGRNYIIDLLENGWKEVYYLDESEEQAGEKDAIGFSEWIGRNGYINYMDWKNPAWGNTLQGKRFTTSELYNIYKNKPQ